MKIKINLIEDIVNFNKTCSKFYAGLIFAEQSSQKVNVKSLLGLYSLDLSQPITVTIETDNKNEEDDFYNFIKKWKVEEE